MVFLNLCSLNLKLPDSSVTRESRSISPLSSITFMASFLLLGLIQNCPPDFRMLYGHITANISGLVSGYSFTHSVLQPWLHIYLPSLFFRIAYACFTVFSSYLSGFSLFFSLVLAYFTFNRSSKVSCGTFYEGCYKSIN